MPQNSPETPFGETKKAEVKKAILRTLAFFNHFQLPAIKEAIYRKLYKQKSTFQEFELALSELVSAKAVSEMDGFYGLFELSKEDQEQRQRFVFKQWRKVNRFFWLLYLLPFVNQLSIINSLALGNTNEKSDIDFFVITKPGLLYTTRSIIIVVLKLLGLYKTRAKIKDRFCFGFFITSRRMSLADILIPGSDPLLAFWFSSFAPLYGRNVYAKFAEANQWIYEYLPNFNYRQNFSSIKKVNIFLFILKKLLELSLIIPGLIIEPLAKFVHISHTDKLPENHWPTSTTIAREDILKLHALDPRKDFREKFYQEIERF